MERRRPEISISTRKKRVYHPDKNQYRLRKRKKQFHFAKNDVPICEKRGDGSVPRLDFLNSIFMGKDNSKRIFQGKKRGIHPDKSRFRSKKWKKTPFCEIRSSNLRKLEPGQSVRLDFLNSDGVTPSFFLKTRIIGFRLTKPVIRAISSTESSV